MNVFLFLVGFHEEGFPATFTCLTSIIETVAVNNRTTIKRCEKVNNEDTEQVNACWEGGLLCIF